MERGYIGTFEDLRSCCRKQGAIFRFDSNGQVTNDKEQGEVLPACCFTPKMQKEMYDNWQPCNEDNCPYWGYKFRR